MSKLPNVEIVKSCKKLSKLLKLSTNVKIVKNGKFFSKFVNIWQNLSKNIVKFFQNCQKLLKKVSLVTFWHSMTCHMFQNQKWLTESVSQWVSDKVTYWAVRWQLKMYMISVLEINLSLIMFWRRPLFWLKICIMSWF